MLGLVFKLLFLVICGAFLVEVLGSRWHQLVSHLGILRGIANDFCRRRHHDHHLKYGVTSLLSRTYQKSCEVTYHPMGVLIIVVLVCLVLTGVMSWHGAVAIFSGALLYGIGGLGTLHDLYHIKASELRKFRLFQNRYVWKIYRWLRDYHLIHHHANKNFAILFPLIDLIWGSYVSPTQLPQYRKDLTKREELFPGFNPRLSSTCGESLFSTPVNDSVP